MSSALSNDRIMGAPPSAPGIWPGLASPSLEAGFPQASEAGDKPNTLRWLARLAFDAAIVAVAVGMAIVQPPLSECNARSATGFYYGETYGRCLASKVGERARLLDQRLTMIVLSSGR